MYSCCFFGHRQIRSCITKELRSEIIKLIVDKSVSDFYVGNNGAFDCTVQEVLKELSVTYPFIRYTVVLAYLRTEKEKYNYKSSIYPEGLEFVPKRFAISKRNLWMIEHSDYVITYIDHPFGNAEKFSEIAVKKGKTVINIANKLHEMKQFPIM